MSGVGGKAEYLVTTENVVAKLDPQTLSTFTVSLIAVAIDLTLTPANSAAFDAAIGDVLRVSGVFSG